MLSPIIELEVAARLGVVVWFADPAEGRQTRVTGVER